VNAAYTRQTRIRVPGKGVEGGCSLGSFRRSGPEALAAGRGRMAHAAAGRVSVRPSTCCFRSAPEGAGLRPLEGLSAFRRPRYLEILQLSLDAFDLAAQLDFLVAQLGKCVGPCPSATNARPISMTASPLASSKPASTSSSSSHTFGWR
jgi:hypothetical protein